LWARQSLRLNDVHGQSGVIYEDFLPGLVLETHDDALAAGPCTIELAEPGVTVSVRIFLTALKLLISTPNGATLILREP
jgi:hypothetical protein